MEKITLQQHEVDLKQIRLDKHPDCSYSIIGAKFKLRNNQQSEELMQRVPLGGFCDKNIDKMCEDGNVIIKTIDSNDGGKIPWAQIHFPKFCNTNTCKKFEKCSVMQINNAMLHMNPFIIDFDSIRLSFIE